MLCSEATRIRILRALLGVRAKDFAKRLGVTAQSLTAWESGRYYPSRKQRDALARICQDEGIAFMPSGMPVPMSDLIPKEEK